MFYVGVVENRIDPLKLGRCQVRVVGLHTEDKAALPTKDLPWAYPVQPITSAAMSGIGYAPVGPVEGTWVMVVFRDKDNQMPIMLGTIGGIPMPSTSENVDLTSAIGTTPSANSNTSTSAPPSSGTSPKMTSAPAPITDSDSIIGPLAKLIAKAESGSAGYNAYNRGTSGGKIVGGSGPISLTTMSIQEIMEKQALPPGDSNRLFAVGKYQCIPVTLKAACQSLNIDTSTKFNEKIQDIICQEYLVCRKRPPLVAYYKNPDKNNEDLLKKAGASLAAEFSSIEDPNYLGYPYGGPDGKYYKGGNRAHTMWAVLKPTLIAEWEFRNEGKGKSSPLAKEGVEKTDAEKASTTTAGGAGDALDKLLNILNDTFGLQIPIGGKDKSGEPSDGGAVNTNIGFTDPTGKYPLYQNEPDTNRLAINNKIEETIVFKKEAAREITVPIANGGTWDQPAISYNATYPFNHVWQSESGHVMEFDDTQDCERVQIYHRKGSYIEWDANGSQINKIVGDGYEIVDRNGYVFVKGAQNVSVVGSLNVRTDNIFNLDVSGVANINIFSDANINVSGDTNFATQGELNIKASKINMESTGEINIKSATDTNIQSLADLHLKSNANMFIGSKTNTNISAAEGLLNIQSKGDINAKTEAAIKLQSTGDANIKTGANLKLEAAGTGNLKSGDTLAMDGSIINIQNGSSASADEAGDAVGPSNAGQADIELPVETRETSGVDSLPQLTITGRGSEVGFDSPDAGDPSAYAQEQIDKNIIVPGQINQPKIEIEKSAPGASSSTAPIGANCDIIYNMDPSQFSPTMKLSKHFTLGDLTKGGTRIPRVVYNVNGRDWKPQEIVCNLKGLAENVLDKIVDKYGKDSFIITSAFRRPPYNGQPGDLGTQKEGGDHPVGCAADLSFKGGKNRTYEICKELPALLGSWNQIIMEYNGDQYWIHVAFKYNGNKGHCFTMNHHQTYGGTFPNGGFVLV